MLNPCVICKCTNIRTRSLYSPIAWCHDCGFIVHGGDEEWNQANPLKADVIPDGPIASPAHPSPHDYRTGVPETHTYAKSQGDFRDKPGHRTVEMPDKVADAYEALKAEIVRIGYDQDPDEKVKDALRELFYVMQIK